MAYTAPPSESKFDFARDYPSEHGVAALGSHRLDPKLAAAAAAATAAAKPARPMLTRVLSVVPEGGDDEDDSDAEGTVSEADSAAGVSALQAFAARGMLPRPGACSHLVLPSQRTAGTAAHFDQVPFTVRAPTDADAPALHQLQAHVAPGALRRRLSLRALRRLIQGGAGRWQWVAEVDGAIVAAVLLGKLPSGQSGTLEFRLAAVHPALEERAEVFCALANFAVQALLADPSVVQLLQGVLCALPAAGPDAMLARLAVAHSGKSDRSQTFPAQERRRSGNVEAGSSSPPQRDAVFVPGLSFDDFVAWVTAQTFTTSMPRRKTTLDGEALAAGAATGAAVTRAAPLSPGAARRSKLTSIVKEARRLTSTAGLNDAGEF
jgi:hypothetical protein